MKSKKEKKITKLKTKHVWPSVLFFIVALVFAVSMTIGVGVLVIEYLIEKDFLSNFSGIEILADMVDDRYVSSQDMQKELEKIQPESGKYKDIVILDKNREVIAFIGNNNVSLEETGNFSIDENLSFYVDSDIESISSNSLEVFWKNFEMMLDGNEIDDNIEVFSPEWNSKPVYKFGLWTNIPMEKSGYYFVARTEPSVSVRDGMYLVSIMVAIMTITTLPLIFMFVNVINNFKDRRKMLELLYLDGVTGGKNWLYFKDTAKKILSKRINRGATFVICDLQVMKYRSFCACSGPSEGEKLLETIYGKLNLRQRKDEVIVRFEKANFALLLRVKDEEQANLRLNQIFKMLEGINPNYIGAFHIGYAMITSSVVKDYKNVDISRLYNFASAARASINAPEENVIASFSEKLLEEQRWEHDVETKMEAALNNKEFKVYYQPKYNPVTNELAGAEALIRWFTPEGLVSPGRFIPIFEKNGFITKIDDYMISSVAQQQAEWYKEGKRIVPVSVNVSRAHFTMPGLAEHILELVDVYDVPHKYIEIELTESAFFDDKKVLLEVVNKLKKYGFEISMDDFGAGYSSLNSLKDLPLDVLKLDAGFFRGEGDNIDERAEIVVSETISLAKQLNMRIVAEGIEKKNQVEFLANHDCDMIQGYYYAKPMPAEEYVSRMDNPITEN